MRIVQFPYAGGVVVYPEEGVSAFGKTATGGGFCFGEYFGVQTDPTLADYLGVWPVPNPPTYETVMDAYTFKLQLTDDEFDLWWDSVDVVLKHASTRLTARNDVVDVESQKFSDVMVAAVAAGVLTQQRADELSLGLEQ